MIRIFPGRHSHIHAGLETIIHSCAPERRQGISNAGRGEVSEKCKCGKAAGLGFVEAMGLWGMAIRPWGHGHLPARV